MYTSDRPTDSARACSMRQNILSVHSCFASGLHTASPECTFSAVKILETYLRSRLTNETGSQAVLSLFG